MKKDYKNKSREELIAELKKLQQEHDLLKAKTKKDLEAKEKRAAELVIAKKEKEAANLYAVFESSPVAMFVIDDTTNIVMINLAFTVMCGGSESDILQHRPGEALRCVHSHTDPRGCGYSETCKYCNVRNGVEGLIANGGSLHGAELELELTRNGEPGKYWMNIGVEPLIMNGQGHWCIAMDDVTPRKKAEEENNYNSQLMKALLQLNQMRDSTLQEITDFTLEEAVRLTQSKIGYLAFLNEDESILNMHSWSKSAMAECAIADKPFMYPVVNTGLWGEAVRQRKAIITNDYLAANPLIKGTPQGHVNLKRHMNTPVFDGSKMVIVAGVGNKNEEYNDKDVQHLTLLMEGMWRILESIKAEEALRESARKFSDTVKYLDEGYYSVTMDGILLEHNLAFNRILGIDVMLDMKGAKLPDFWQNPEERTEYLGELMTTGIIKNYEINAKTISEEEIHVVVNSHLVKDENDKLIRIEGTFIDITSLKQAEADLRIKNKVFDDSIASQSIADSTGIITHVNPAFLKMWGYSSIEEAIGNSVGSFFADPADASPVLEALAEYDAWDGEFKAKAFDGRTFISHGFASSLRNASGELIGYQSTNLDVTKEREAEAQLVETLAALKRSNQELEQFAYVASHDLQEPLRLVASYTQLLERRYKDQLDQDANDFIQYAVDGANRMQKLINDLLDYSRVSSKGKEFAKVDASQILGQAVANLHQLITDNTAMVTNEELPVLHVDESQIIRVFQNLIENAIKYKKKDELPKIHISCEKKDKFYEFALRDNGIGIDMQYQNKVFVIFQRLHAKEEYPGTGIGLSICKRIVERHGGKIWFESKVNEGSTFYFTLKR